MKDQLKRKKVIKGLECCATDPFTANKCTTLGCPYVEDKHCIKKLAKDALALLKAQEPVEPTVGGDADGPCGNWWYQCGKCKEAIDYHDSYCRNCGRSVKWE